MTERDRKSKPRVGQDDTAALEQAIPMEPTLTVAVTAHSEGALLRPTLRSISVAMAALAARSITCELVIVLDNATAATTREATHWKESDRLGVPVRLVVSSTGDAGASRNAAAQNARGTYLALCDGDDLVSSNYFSAALDLLTESEQPRIIHPGTVLSFGARSALWEIPASDSVSHLDLIRHNLWPSSSVSQRSTYLTHPYAQLDPMSGFGPEDWLWNIETTTSGIPHLPAPGTMFFYRVRQTGGVNNSHMRSIMPAFDVDALVAALPLTPRSAEAAHVHRRPLGKRLLRRGYRIARPAIRVVTGPLGQARRERLYAWAVGLARPASEKRTLPPGVEAALIEASELEPAISWTAFGYNNLEKWNSADDGYAQLLVSLVDQLRGHADAIVAVPWVGIGGADLVSRNYAKVLAADSRFGGRVTMLATYTPARTLRHLIPPGVHFVQVPETFRDLSPDHQRRLLAQVFLLVAPKLVVSVNCFDVTNSLQLYGHQLGSTTDIYLTLFAFDRIGAGYPVNPITDDSQREFLDEIRGVLTDNTVTAALVEEMLALDDAAVRVHHQPALDPIPHLTTGTRAYNNRHFSSANPFKVVWPHRLDKEKRPDTLIAIANRLRADGAPVEIHVYGQQVLSTDGRTLMKELADAGIVYDGPYEGGLSALPTYDFHALLLTSESEGLPLVLVQSMLLGLPVISSAVGGVTDIVIDDVTGLLAQGPEDIDGFVSAIHRLLESIDDRRRLIHAAYDFAVEQHGWQAFSRLVDAL